MATRKSALEEERMTKANIAKVITMLNPPEGSEHKPWTKKECCSFLGMAYNTTRLGTIIDKYKADKERDLKRRNELRGKPATNDEIVYTLQEYLHGATVDYISKTTFRSAEFVKHILHKYECPIRNKGHSYFDPILIPETSLVDRHNVGDIVYSTRYDSLAKILDEYYSEKHCCYIYKIWLMSERQLQHAYQEVYELASLEHLRKLGVKL